jgi:protein-disulfide isomerase
VSSDPLVPFPFDQVRHCTCKPSGRRVDADEGGLCLLCFLGLLVLAVLALFSVRYRPLAREAFDCVFRRVTLRECTTGLDQRLKAMVTGRLVTRHPGTARFLHRHLEALAWIFVVLLVASSSNLAYAFYNFYRYGNCYGPTGTGFCVFDPSGRRSRYSGIVTGHHGEIVPPGDGGKLAFGQQDARVTILEFGSYTCPYTRADEHVVRAIVGRHPGEVRLVFRHFPLDGLAVLRGEVAVRCEESSREAQPEGAIRNAAATRAAIAAECAGVQGRFWDYHEHLAASPDALASCGRLIELARSLGMDEAAFGRCLEDPLMREQVRRDFEDGVKAGIYGTPTFFIGGFSLVAPSPDEIGEAVDRALRAAVP